MPTERKARALLAAYSRDCCGFDAEGEYRPRPFGGEAYQAYQWVRNEFQTSSFRHSNARSLIDAPAERKNFVHHHRYTFSTASARTRLMRRSKWLPRLRSGLGGD